MKYYLALFALVSFSNANSQANKKYPKTVIYSGSYFSGSDIEHGGYVSLVVYPETDSTILFYFESNRGAPSYSMGQLYGRLKIANGMGNYYSSAQDTERSCQFSCEFKANRVVIKTIDDKDNCGFGYGVLVDGIYKRYSAKVPTYFEDETGGKVYFKKTSPENWDAP